MEKKKQGKNARLKRHLRIRSKISGSAERPRLCVFRSLKNMYAQLIDDEKGHTLIGVSTLSPEVKATVSYGGNIAAAKEVGKVLAKKALEQNITEVVFDRGGYKYHGRVAALAEEVRQNGVKF
ncbi:50S ribosomal protein L18 [candidate division KSB3 bacterium]|uniref:Large ribosomal subunit protein uL18 n=1 Tax=candidate division KSB3 bacterium TaxID=2044937 RepID=A0A2G6KJI8_9BACT|nr:MAG: 50S ribosomal protein L18 [candidate division KSB3 bacterium]